MRVVLFANNWLGWQIARWLSQRGEEIVGLVLHPESQRKYGEEIITSSQVGSTRIFIATELRDSSVLTQIEDLNPDIGVSALFGFKLKQALLDRFPKGCINVHPSFLPYNRGAFPNVWSIVEGTPAGATVHYMDCDIDTGDIIAQKELKPEPTDTGESLYRKLMDACLGLFVQTWPLVGVGRVPRTPQPRSQGTFHKARDVEEIDEIQLNRTYTARELLDVIRARTFAPYAGAYFRTGGRKVYLRLQLLYENELEGEA
jgi:methionyl-tRNA formyltransferase